MASEGAEVGTGVAVAGVGAGAAAGVAAAAGSGWMYTYSGVLAPDGGLDILVTIVESRGSQRLPRLMCV